MAKKNPAITLTVPPRKPRNPVVVAALTRRAGSHDKPHKVARQQSRQRLQRALSDLLRGDQTEFEVE
jgi:hypothetical protein